MTPFKLFEPLFHKTLINPNNPLILGLPPTPMIITICQNGKPKTLPPIYRQRTARIPPSPEIILNEIKKPLQDKQIHRNPQKLLQTILESSPYWFMPPEEKRILDTTLFLYTLCITEKQACLTKISLHRTTTPRTACIDL